MGRSSRSAADDPAPAPELVATAMLRHPKVCPPDLTVAAARIALADDHVHALLPVRGAQLLAAVERGDLLDAPADDPARRHGQLAGRVVSPAANLTAVRSAMKAGNRRRLAVVDSEGSLLGLLCLKSHGHGFCSPHDVAARLKERELVGLAHS